MNVLLKNKMPLLFLSISLVYIYFTFPVYSTGDGGEFASVGSTLGIAHPSGYPLYTQLIKLASFIPIGNIPGRMSLVTVFFSVLSLYILYLILKELKVSKNVSLVMILILSSIYSFIGQSVVIKFYTLNLFLISLSLYFLIKLLNTKEDKYFILNSFLIGLISSNHHTGFFILAPLLISVFIIKYFNTKAYLKGIFLVFLGFSINFYLFLRSTKDYIVNYMPIRDFNTFIEYYLRKNYGASSVDVAKQAISHSSLDSFIQTFMNVFTLLTFNLGYFLFITALVGIFLLFKQDRKIFAILFISLLLYSVFLAKMTLGMENPSIRDWYVQGHQYFVPLLFISFIFIAITIQRILDFLEYHNYFFAKKLLILTFVFIGLVNYIDRFKDQNFFNDYVPYSYAKANLSILPLSSIFLTRDDSIIYGSWYLKVANGFRSDVCSLEFAPEINKLYMRGCKPDKIYKSIFYKSSEIEFTKFVENNLMYSSYSFSENDVFGQLYKTKFIGLIYKVVPKFITFNLSLDDIANKEKYIKTLTYDCLNHSTDDYYTLSICNFSANYYVYYWELLNNLGYRRESDLIMDLYYQIREHNDLGNSFYSKGVKK